MASKILVVGGSYAGISAVKTILKLTSRTSAAAIATEENLHREPVFGPDPGPVDDKKFEITLLDPRAGFINIMAIPKLILDPEFAEKSYVPISKWGIAWDSVSLYESSNDAENMINKDREHHIGSYSEPISRNPNVKVNFIQGYVTNLSLNKATYSQQKIIKNKTPSQFLTNIGESNLEDRTILFDYCILASGRSRNWPFDPLAINEREFIKEMKRSAELFTTNNKFSIIGGGALGIEVAGELKQTYPKKQVDLIHPHPTLPPEPLLSDTYKEKMVLKVKEAGINLRLNTRVQDEILDNTTGTPTTLVTTSGDKIISDVNLWCNYHRNNINYLQNELFKNTLTGKSKDEIAVNDLLQVQTTSGDHVFGNIFAVGDLPELGIIKKAGGAFTTARLAANNVVASINGTSELHRFPAEKWPKDKMAIVIGSNRSVQSKQGQVIVDSPAILQSYADYKNSKVAKRLGLEMEKPNL